MSEFPFLGGSFNGRSSSFDAQRTVNLYVETTESGSSRSGAMLVGTPGLLLWTSLAGGRVRGMIAFNATTSIIVCGSNVWKVTSDKTASLLGVVADTGPVVSMASNGQTVMLVGGAAGYFIDPVAQTVTEITDLDFEGSSHTYFVDGYFVFNKLNTGQFQLTQLYGTDIDGLDYATAEGSPDLLVSLIVDHRETWLFGTQSVEVWTNVGNPDFAFQRIQGAFLEIGCAAPHSVAKMDNAIFWLANDNRGFGTVQRAVGYSSARVSNHAFETAITSYERIDDAVAFTYSQEGHSFYVLSFPSAGATWCYDASTNLWHERAYRLTTGDLTRHRANCQMNFAGLTLVGDWEIGNIYVLDLDTYTDNGVPIQRMRICPHIAGGAKNVFHQSLELLMQTGVGLSSGQGSDPQAMLSWSDDGGYGYGNEIWATIGKIGERRARVKWRRLGKSRDRVYKVVVTDPIPVVFTACELTVAAGSS